MPKESKKGTRLAKRSTPFPKRAKPVTKGKPVAKGKPVYQMVMGIDAPYNPDLELVVPQDLLPYNHGLDVAMAGPQNSNKFARTGKRCPKGYSTVPKSSPPMCKAGVPQKDATEKRKCKYPGERINGKCPKPTIKKLNEEIKKLNDQIKQLRNDMENADKARKERVNQLKGRLQACNKELKKLNENVVEAEVVK